MSEEQRKCVQCGNIESTNFSDEVYEHVMCKKCNESICGFGFCSLLHWLNHLDTKQTEIDQRLTALEYEPGRNIMQSAAERFEDKAKLQ